MTHAPHTRERDERLLSRALHEIRNLQTKLNAKEDAGMEGIQRRTLLISDIERRISTPIPLTPSDADVWKERWETALRDGDKDKWDIMQLGLENARLKHDLERAIENHSADLTPSDEMVWRPIASAPTGNEILCCAVRDDGTLWICAVTLEIPDIRASDSGQKRAALGLGWWYPTHWMPLPAAPKSGGNDA